MASRTLRITSAVIILMLFALGNGMARTGRPAPIPAGQATAAPAAEASPSAAPPVGEQTFDPPLSTRVVSYTINAHLIPDTHKVEATETLTYHNLTGQPLDVFPFHLYLNAFQPKSSWIQEGRLNNPDFEWKPERLGSITVKKLDVDGAGDLTSQMQFIQPDNENKDDHTVFQIHLPTPIPPGGNLTVHFSFEDQLPQVLARTGYLRDFFMVGQWFPKVGVWWKGAWNCHQFHRDTEFFADFGSFDVKLTVPASYLVGAGGDAISETSNADGTRTLGFHSEDVHDFSWTASPSYRLVEDSWTGSAGTVKIHLLMSPGHEASDARYLKAVKGTLTLYDEWIGPYPYDRLTIVDPPHGGFNAGGMEYPTLITADTDRLVPEGVLIPEVVVEHEFGHQYWYGMVATNEFEEAWLDEGINSYVEVKVMDALYGKETSFFNFHGFQLSEDAAQRTSYLGKPDYDPLTRFAWKFVDGNSYGGITYGKTATVLLTLEKVIGEQTMRKAVHTYFMRYRFTHPTGEDFLKTIEEVSGQNLRWYFDQAVSGTNVFDYEVASLRSDRADWYEAHPPAEKKGETLYRTYVLLHRKGDFLFPVDVDVKFDNGETVREHWDGQDRWIRFTYLKKAQAVSAEIDPDRQLLLDKDPFNNSYRVQADFHATHKIAGLFVFVAEWISQFAAWLV
jgi:hypothetical protein